MSVPAEIIGQQLPLAAEIAGIDAAYFLAVGAVATAGVAVRKLTHQWHETIPEGYRGVLFHAGQPVEKKIVEPDKLKDYEQPGFWRQRQHRYFPHAGHFVTQQQLELGVGKHVILPPDFYFVGPFASLETVSVADQPMETNIEFDFRNGDHMKKLQAQVQITWGINPNGDNPLLAVTQIDHEMKSKKDTTDKDDKDRQMQNQETKSKRINAILTPRLLQAIEQTGMGADDVCTLEARGKTEVAADMVELSQESLSRYGFEIRTADIVSIRRIDLEAFGDNLARSGQKADPGVAAAVAARQEADASGHGAVVPLSASVDG